MKNLIHEKTKQYISDLKSNSDKKLDVKNKNKAEIIFKNIQENKNYTDQQKELLLAKDPYVLGAAGAGCGKTHTLIGRLYYLDALGYQPDNILNISFSNAAVNNILSRFPNAQVSTIASLCQLLYRLNFSSNIKFNFYTTTFINSLKIAKFSEQQLHALSQTNPALTNLNIDSINKTKDELIKIYSKHYFGPYNERISIKDFYDKITKFINEHFDEVKYITQNIGQVETTLSELMINNMLDTDSDNFIWPEEFNNLQMMTLDECQDTSSIELMLILNIVKNKKLQLFMLGDANQTLFEWRSADPEMIDLLQKDTLFTNYQLTNNFRSKAGILKYANHILSDLNTNQKNPVEFNKEDTENVSMSDFKQEVSLSGSLHSLSEQSINWIEDKMKNNEQVAILAPNQKLTHEAVDILQARNHQSLNVLNLVAKRPETIDSISGLIAAGSKYISKFNNEHHANIGSEFLTFLESLTNKVEIESSNSRINPAIIRNHLYRAYQYLNGDNNAQEAYNRWYNHEIDNIQYTNVAINILIETELFLNDQARKEYEKSLETISSADLKDFDIVVSTIHSAKGLEFDNCIIMYDETNYFYQDGIQQEQLRAYGVAITRAKKEEHIVQIIDPAQSSDSGLSQNSLINSIPISDVHANISNRDENESFVYKPLILHYAEILAEYK